MAIVGGVFKAGVGKSRQRGLHHRQFADPRIIVGGGRGAHFAQAGGENGDRVAVAGRGKLALFAGQTGALRCFFCIPELGQPWELLLGYLRRCLLMM